MSKIRPLRGFILIEPVSAETKTKSGIILPDSAKQETPGQGKVLSFGEPEQLENGKEIVCPVKVGDKVVYKRWAADEIKIDSVEYKIAKFSDLIAVLE